MSRTARRSASLAAEVYRIPLEGDASRVPTKEAVGSKAHNLMRLTGYGLAVPPAFVLGTGLCRDYLKKGASSLDGLDAIWAIPSGPCCFPFARVPPFRCRA
jgi:hypothetical protein